jgi:hypothetical protein
MDGIFGGVTVGAGISVLYLIAAPPGSITPEVMMIFWLIGGLILEICAVAFAAMSWLLMVFIAEVGLAFFCNAFGSFVLAGWLMMIFSAFCIYFTAAILWLEVFRKPVLPLGRPIVG